MSPVAESYNTLFEKELLVFCWREYKESNLFQDIKEVCIHNCPTWVGFC